jgi:biotin operon repressor
MYDQQSKKIEERFNRAIALIWCFKVNLKVLAEQLNVSKPTTIRIVRELRRRGIDIKAVRDSSGWHYEVTHIGLVELPPAELIKSQFSIVKT